MEEVKEIEVKETKPKRKTTGKKKTETTGKKKTEPKVEPKVEDTVDYKALFEQMQEQMKLMQEQMKMMEVKKEEKAETIQKVANKNEKWNKAKLMKIKDEIIEVRSCYDGVVGYTSPKTNTNYKWIEKGDIEVLTIEEILAMNTKKIYFQTPLLIVEDDRIIEALGLKNIYEAVQKIENIDELIEMDLEDIEDIIGRLSNNHKINLRDEVAKKIKNEEIRDYVVVQALKRILNIEFI